MSRGQRAKLRRSSLPGILSGLLWSVLAVAGLGFVATSGQSETPMAASLRGVLIVAVLGLSVTLTAVSAWIRPQQRAALSSLTIGLVLWGTASMFITTTTTGAPTESGGASMSGAEWLFLSSYLGFAAFLLLDGRRRTDWSSALLLEALVLTGGAASAAGILVFLPISRLIGHPGCRCWWQWRTRWPTCCWFWCWSPRSAWADAPHPVAPA